MSLRSIVLALSMFCMSGLAFAKATADIDAARTSVRAGLASWEAGRDSEAEQALREVVELDLGASREAEKIHVDAVSALGAILMNQRRFDEAHPYVTAYREIASKHRGNQELIDAANQRLGRCLIGLGRYGEARNAFAAIKGTEAESARRQLDAIDLVQPLLEANDPASLARFRTTLEQGLEEHVVFIARGIVTAEREKAPVGRRAVLCAIETDLDLAMQGDFWNDELHAQLVDTAWPTRPD